MDDLLGRRNSGQSEEKSAVVWPPPSPLPDEDKNYPSPLFSPSPPPPLTVHHIPSSQNINNQLVYNDQLSFHENNNNDQLTSYNNNNTQLTSCNNNNQLTSYNNNNNNQLTYSNDCYQQQSYQASQSYQTSSQVVNFSQYEVDNKLANPEIKPMKSSLKKRSQSEGERRRRFSNNSLHEIDQQIVMIQNEFEAELDNLIDAYRHVQQKSSKKKGT